MKFYARIALVAFTLGLLGQISVAQQNTEKRTTYAETITQEDLKKHLSILASDEFEGRETGTPGQKKAAEYIANHFKNLGLVGPVKQSDNPYYQTFELEQSRWESITFQTNSQTLKGFEHFVPYGRFEMDQSVEFVFAGYGIEHENYSDYAALGSVEGKIIVLLSGEPKNRDGNYLISGGDAESDLAGTRNKLRYAQSKGALGAIIIDPQFDQRLSYYTAMLSRPSLGFPKKGEDDQKPFAIFYSSQSNAATMLGTSEKSLEKTIKKIEKKEKSYAGKFKAKLNVKAKRSTEMIETENVLGFLEGTDKKEEILVITSHYDHIGVSPNGEINNGADDDGSGTVGVLEIAEAFSKAASEGIKPRRSILFMTVTGEEKGLLGSEYYSDNPIFALENTVTNLNIDMIGRVDDPHEDNPNYVYIIGSDMLSSELHSLSEQVAKKYKPNFTLDYTYNDKDDPNRFYYRSDHYNFAKHNIPVIFYFNGTHPDYHRPTDTVDKIHFEKLMHTSQLIFQTAWELANRDSRVVVDKADTDDD